MDIYGYRINVLDASPKLDLATLSQVSTHVKTVSVHCVHYAILAAIVSYMPPT
jgi:hypothetical protein